MVSITYIARHVQCADADAIISHYTPTKAGILSLMQSCAVALGKYNIRANAILPGTIATDINKKDLSDEAKRESMIKRTCLGRLGGEPLRNAHSTHTLTREYFYSPRRYCGSSCLPC